MKTILSLFFLVLFLTGFSQKKDYNYQEEFKNAYNVYPNVPKGLLEAVSYTMTRFNHLQNTTESCVGLPKTYGVMGLTLDGKGYFKNNLNYISQVSGVSVQDILDDPKQHIMAYAAAYEYELTLLSPFYNKSENYAHILSKLCELPDVGIQENYALNAHLYAVLSFLNDSEMQQAYDFPNHQLNLLPVFGIENLKVLQSAKVVIDGNNIEGDNNTKYKKINNNKSIDYPPAIQDMTTCNFSSRNGVAVSAVTVHTIQGSYAGAISWFKNCTANVSAHYVLRSSDGQVTQMVLESDKGWHVGSENPYTIGLEHEGFVNDSSWYTAAMYQSSADLVIDITQSGYGIDPKRTAYFPWTATTNYNVTSTPGSCIKVKGHQHFPNQTHTDPGANWDWDYYFRLINDPTSTTIVNTNTSGNATDLGGSSTYTNDERTLFLIQPTNATSIALTVNQFDTEVNWDYLYLYEGTTVFDPLIGRYNGTSIPPTINVNSGAVLVEFRSDCATTSDGYDISWNSTITGITELLTSHLKVYPNPAKDQLTIEFDKPYSSDLIVTDITGRIVFTQELNQKKVVTILLDEFSSGVYLLKVEDSVVRFVKQ